ncbi:MAG: hypothetical protein PHH00_00660 [Candidatus Nanoarchaeia archaeon]|nr:hypothetical protein [Candidatus Nanoarchaeia archaeon]
MGKSQILAVLALASFLLILFMPTNKNYWAWFLLLGVIFGVFWLFMK